MSDNDQKVQKQILQATELWTLPQTLLGCFVSNIKAIFRDLLLQTGHRGVFLRNAVHCKDFSQLPRSAQAPRPIKTHFPSMQ